LISYVVFLTADVAYSGATPQGIANAHVRFTPAPFDQYRSQLTPSLCDGVMKLDSHNP
jgi:hypothetical protein